MAFPYLLDGTGWDDEPQPTQDEAYRVEPDKGVRPVPAYSRRQRFAELAVRTAAFKRNAANRLWAHMLGRGLVEPVDFHHADNPPVHPQLLRLLADELGKMNFNIKGFLNEIALSQTYQRAIDLPSIAEPDCVAAETALPELQRQLELQKLVCQRADSEAERVWDQLTQSRTELAQVRAEIQNSINAINDGTKKLREASAELNKTQGLLDAARQAAEQLGKAADTAKQFSDKKPDDADLAKAASTLRARADATAKEAANLEAQGKEKRSAIDALTATIAKGREAIAQLAPKRDSLAAQATEHRGGYLAIVTQRDKELDLAGQLEQKIRTCRQLIAYRDRLADRRRAAEKADELQSQLAGLQRQEADAAGERQKIEVEVASFRAEHDRTRNALAECDKRCQDQAQAASALQEAIAKTEQVLSQLGSDVELTSAVETLRRRVELLHIEQDNIQSLRSTCQSQFEQAVAALDRGQARLRTSIDRIAMLGEQVRAATSALESARQELATASAAADAAFDEVTASWTERFIVGSLKPLSPEQLAWSTMQALEMDGEFRKAAEEEWKSQLKDKTPEQVDPQQRQREIEQLYKKKRRSIESTFVSLFAAPPASPQDVFTATVDQSLYFSNDGGYRSWLGAAAGRLIERWQNAPDGRSVAEGLYLAILSRLPTDDEAAEIGERLAAPEPNRAAAAQDLYWSLLTSVEFRFNH
jgi:hypothetical protein